MPSLSTLASFLVGLALLAASSAQEPADGEKLYTALGNVDSYSPDVTTYLCVDKINGQEMQAADYKFDVTGCNADKEFVGRCPDLTSFPDCGSYSIVVSGNKVTSITGQKMLRSSGGKCQGK